VTQVVLNGAQELEANVGQEIGVTEWVQITQDMVDAFADATGDHQWIHVDPERAAQSPFGGTIAHGYFTLSLAGRFLQEMLSVQGFAAGINYGLEKVRFPAPMPTGDSLRMRLAIETVDEVRGGVQVMCSLTFERRGGDKPVCVAQALVRFLDG
jgi:acyl dehydratase